MTANEWLDRHKPTPRQVWGAMIFDLLLAVAMFTFWVISDNALFAVLCGGDLISAWLAYCVFRIYSSESAP